MQPNYRRCISCRKIAPKSDFLRIVRQHPSHTVVLDTGMGRSAYLCPQRQCLQTAQKKDRLARVLKAPVSPELYQALYDCLTQSSLDKEAAL